MRHMKPFLLLCTAIFLFVTVAVAQSPQFPNFSSTANLQLNGSPHTVQYSGQTVLRLTDGGNPGQSPRPEASTVWFTVPQTVTSGFTTYFKFQVHNPANCCQPGDGLAFVVQNSTYTDPTYGASGAGVTALGVTNGGMGYAGIPNSLAVEFDTREDPWDPTPNHVAVQSSASCLSVNQFGGKTNGPVHDPGTYTIGSNNNVTSCLLNQSQQSINSSIGRIGVNCTTNPCSDGAVHQVVIEYAPPSGENQGSLQVFIDPQFIQGTHTPVQGSIPQINVPYDISTDLGGGTTALVGLTGSQPNLDQVEDVFAWEFTPHTNQTITQTIQNGGTQTTFVFGGHVYAATYPQGFQNNQGILMSVTAMLIDKTTFYNTRLRNAGPPFSGEQCITYLETGGNCIVYRVNCEDQNGNSVTCPTEDQCSSNNLQACIFFKTSFYPQDNVTQMNADYIKDPTEGQNQWQELLNVQYQPNVFDGSTSGRGGGTSDFVATVKVHH